MEERASEAFRQAAAVLPPALRRRALTLPREEQDRTEELRLRVGRPLSAVTDGEERPLGGPPVTAAELGQLVEIASRASLHAVLPQLCRGYLTLEGGHRLGLCGTAVMERGEIRGLRQLSSANLRVARQVRGAAREVLPRLCRAGRLESTLILAPPGAGKTTLLRDLIRMVSDGEGCVPLRVSLADERGEVAALWNGVPQLEVGRNTDVMEGCPKAQGLMLLLRAMNPQVLAADEITAPEDVSALRAALGCGAVLLATAHGTDRADLERRALYRPLMEECCFRYLVRITRKGAERRCHVEELT